jgi:hypothetical protein
MKRSRRPGEAPRGTQFARRLRSASGAISHSRFQVASLREAAGLLAGAAVAGAAAVGAAVAAGTALSLPQAPSASASRARLPAAAW